MVGRVSVCVRLNNKGLMPSLSHIRHWFNVKSVANYSVISSNCKL